MLPCLKGGETASNGGYDWQASRTRIKDQLFVVSTNVLVCHWLTSRVYGVTCPPPPVQALYLSRLLRTRPSIFAVHPARSLRIEDFDSGAPSPSSPRIASSKSPSARQRLSAGRGRHGGAWPGDRVGRPVFLFRDDFRRCTDREDYPLNLVLFAGLPAAGWEAAWYSSIEEIADPGKALARWLRHDWPPGTASAEAAPSV